MTTPSSVIVGGTTFLTKHQKPNHSMKSFTLIVGTRLMGRAGIFVAACAGLMSPVESTGQAQPGPRPDGDPIFGQPLRNTPELAPGSGAGFQYSIQSVGSGGGAPSAFEPAPAAGGTALAGANQPNAGFHTPYNYTPYNPSWTMFSAGRPEVGSRPADDLVLGAGAGSD